MAVAATSPFRIDPALPPVLLLDRLGPGASAPGGPFSETEAIAYCRGLAGSHYENFSVLTGLVPMELRDDFAAVYAFCRWSDDLADETGADDAARARSLELLAWWRAELARCFTGEADHPVFVALRATLRRHPALAMVPFTYLIDAFEQDQRVRRYETWEQLLGYCARSANPVGRIVLALGGYPETPANARRYAMSDATCTALQLINFWQDVRRDLLERDRVYLPSRDTGVSEAMLQDWLRRPDDPAARVPYIRAVRPLVERTAALFAEGRPLPGTLDRRLAPVVWLFGAGGEATLRAVERIGCATLWTRPRLTRPQKAALVGRAWLRARLAAVGGGGKKGAAGRGGEA